MDTYGLYGLVAVLAIFAVYAIRQVVTGQWPLSGRKRKSKTEISKEAIEKSAEEVLKNMRNRRD